MALIYRCVLETDDRGVVESSESIFRDWLRTKFRKTSLEVPTDGEERTIQPGSKAVAVAAANERGSAFRGRLIEERPDEQVISTATAIETNNGSWFWFDLARSTSNAWDRPWVPFAPRMVSMTLERFSCTRGPNGLTSEFHVLEGDQGKLLAAQILDSGREVPFTIVSPSRIELRDGIEPAIERAHQLQRRLAGVTPVYVLGKGSVSAFSKAMLDEVGLGMDVHSGATRVYVPGIGGDRDWPRRHRLIPNDRFERKRHPAAAMADFVASSVLQSASHQSVPKAWLEFRELPEFSGGVALDPDWDELEKETGTLERALEQAQSRIEELELDVMMVREQEVELLSERDDLARRLGYAETQIRQAGYHPEPIQDDGGSPDFERCTEVVDYVQQECPLVALSERVRPGAEELDVHTEPSWAKKAWRSFRALQAYAEEQSSGFEGNFAAFCDSGNLNAIPSTWVALSESETTDSNQRFRELRTFRVPREVNQEECVYMDAHIKIEKGGDPAPRIHFHDDCRGQSGQVHVGWFGPHLDNKSKS